MPSSLRPASDSTFPVRLILTAPGRCHLRILSSIGVQAWTEPVLQVIPQSTLPEVLIQVLCQLRLPTHCSSFQGFRLSFCRCFPVIPFLLRLFCCSDLLLSQILFIFEIPILYLIHLIKRLQFAFFGIRAVG